MQSNPQDEGEQLKTQLFENLRGLINIVDRLRDVGVHDYIKLPRIAVVGTQSAGKSSLLENVVGLDFLPRGDGVVTRRPLEMRLVHKPEMAKPVAFFEKSAEKYTNFEKVREKIVELTDQVAGKKKGIVNDPIVLTIYSADCPDLTLIDLPGITKVALKGSDQSEDIEFVTKNMVKHYCEDERTIILCVLPANQDVTTSDGLLLAKQLDPDGRRTFGVITKIDIMDRGTDARRMLMGQDVELKLGYVGVKNRSQQDIKDSVRVQQALKDEEDYFKKHPLYSGLPPDVLGTKALISKLTTILFQHIKECLPQIMKEIDSKVRDCQEKLQQLGPCLPRDQKERMHLIWNMLTDYTENFKNQIRGKYDIKMHSKVTSEISGGARIRLMLNELYQEFSALDFKPTREYSDDFIEKAIILHQGDSIPGFPSLDSFLYLIIPQLEKLKEPALDTLNQIFIYMDSLSNNILKQVFVRFPQVQDEISEISSRVLTEQRDQAKTIVESIIDSELGYIFTNDPDYLTANANLMPAKEEQPQQQQQQQQQQQLQQQQDPNKQLARELRKRVDAYYSIVIRNLRDSIPKAIGYFLVRAAQDQMQYQLYSEIMKNQGVMQLLDEPEYITQERDTISETLKVLKNAQKVLRKEPEQGVFSLFGSQNTKEVSALEKVKQYATSKLKGMFE